MKTKKFYYTWKNFDEDCAKLARGLRSYKDIAKNIYGVPRGGLVVAVKLSHALGLPLVLSKDQIKQHTIVVDDICDSGATLTKLLKGKRYFIAVCLWAVEDSKFQQVGYIRKKTNQWIVYPWETKQSSKYDDTVIT